MYWILVVMGFFVAVAAALIVGGLATPREHTAIRSRRYSASPEHVWAIVRDVGNYASWREDMIDSELVAAATNEPQVQWREITSGGSVTFGIVDEQPPVRMTARVMDEDLSWNGTWTWEVKPVDGGAMLTITERGNVGNPIFRFIGTHFIGFTREIDRYLRGVEDALHT